MSILEGKKALITGGGSGIGRAITKMLASAGVQVIIHYHTSGDAAEQLADDICKTGGTAYCFKANLANLAEIESLVQFVSQTFNSLDVLVNNAGDLVARHPIEEVDDAFYSKVMSVNLDSMFKLTRAVVPLMKNGQGASIINLSSLAGRAGGASGSLVYSIAKGAVLTFTRSLAKELASHAIRVNAVAPGFVLGSRFHNVHTGEEARQNIIASIPLKRAGTCEDVARVVLFLASEFDGFITGATLDVNGGTYLS